ncbi:O-antigen ligase family protein [Thalassoroseus pseudoceratinae]|uniref:O-antigen ligase family protein n=1 Tax=Thalassoroseus pseudoceratinae TaxID=2713176 RepID=UPI00141D7963|nr:O-antigen ligase family protein [Thalassoroseus pseudoceratinae]
MASPSATGHKSSPVQPDLYSLIQCLIAALVTARLLVPTEGSVLGDTLWLTPLWFLTAALWAWDLFRRRDFHIVADRIDLAVWLIVLGHLISAAYVFATAGDQRAVLNMTWEWLALGVSFGLIRQALRTGVGKRSWLTAFVCLAAGLSVYGLWQHYVEFPANVNRVETLETELSELGSTPSRRAMEIQHELRAMGVPSDGPAKRLWEDRLHSTEPFATFALANTFAGFLACWWIVGIGWWWQARSVGQSRTALAMGLAVLLIVGYCLILTKSRTAWAGLLAGGVFLLGMSFRRRSPQVGRWILYGVAAMFVVGLLFAVATLSGGFDREVLSEAPKSLSYRLEYWQGTAAVIQDSPFFGTGPGNFRAAYLKHKLPGASEEIADPHNFGLDLWVSGGLLAVLAALWLAWLTIQQFSANNTSDLQPGKGSAGSESGWTPIDTGVLLGFLLVLGHRFLFLAHFDTRTIWLAIVWLLVRGLWVPLRRGQAAIPGVVIGAALITLLVHLLGAGGIEMPAIVQLLLLLIAIGVGPQTPRDTSAVTVGILGGCGIALAAGCVLTSTLPVLQREAEVAGGDLAWFENQNFAAATRFYEDAAASDPYSAEPLIRLADLSFQRWNRGHQNNEQDFWKAIEYGKQAIERNPTTAFVHRSVGKYFLQRYDVTKVKTDAEQATEFLAEAVERYPSLPALQAEYAIALKAAGETTAASEAAQTAASLDDLYQAGGHIDKVLSTAVRDEMESLIDSTPTSSSKSQ